MHCIQGIGYCRDHCVLYISKFGDFISKSCSGSLSVFSTTGPHSYQCKISDGNTLIEVIEAILPYRRNGGL